MKLIVIDESCAINTKHYIEGFHAFVYEQENSGNHILILKNMDNLEEKIDDQLTKLQAAGKIVDHDVWIYTLNTNTPSESKILNSHYLLFRNMQFSARAGFWNEEKSLMTLSTFIRAQKSYNSIFKNKLAPSHTLFNQRRSALYHALNNPLCQDDIELEEDACLFIDQWGKHIAEISPVIRRNVWINREIQLSPTTNRSAMYFRSDDFNEKNDTLTNNYIETFKQSYHERYKKALDIACCIPIDFAFNYLSEHTSGTLFVDSNDFNPSSISTNDHYILVCKSKGEAESALTHVKHLGLMPTPSKMRARVANLAYLETPITPDTDITEPLNVFSFNKLDDLINSEVYIKYKNQQYTLSQELSYVKIYHAAVCNMIEGLYQHIKKHDISKSKLKLLQHSYGFIHQYMEWGIRYKDDHRRAINIFQWLIEEITFALIVLKPYKIDEFPDIFKKSLYNLHAELKQDNSIEFNVGLFNSGMRAFFEAIEATIETNTTTNPSIVFTNNVYYETIEYLSEQNIKFENYSQGKLKNSNADIYVTNLMAPLATPDKKASYAVNPIQFVDDIFKERTSRKPVSIILDITATDEGSKLIKNFLHTHKSKINTGKLNIVFFKSLQKYGMLGTDKFQAGYIWTINNKRKFALFNARITNINRQNNALDSQFICHMMKYSYNQIRASFLLSCKNGEIIRNLIKSDLETHHSEQSPFEYYRDNNDKKFQKYSKFFSHRFSFGFPETVIMSVDGENDNVAIRIAAGHEGRSKLTTFAYMISYNHFNKQIYSDLIKLLNIENKPQHLSTNDIRDILYNPEYRDLFCENDSEIVKFAKALLDIPYQLKSEFKNIEDYNFYLKNKILTLDFLTVILRFHHIPIPPEIRGKLNSEYIKLKNYIENSIKNLINLVPHNTTPYPDAFINQVKNISLNKTALRILRDGISIYKNKLMNDDLETISSKIKHYLLLSDCTKMQKDSFARDLTVDLIYLCYQLSFNYELEQLQTWIMAHLSQTPIYNNISDTNLPSVILQKNLFNNTYSAHIFFNDLESVMQFSESANIMVDDRKNKAYPFIDKDRRFSKDPVISALYKRYVVKIPIEKYGRLLQEEKSILPDHNVQHLKDNCDELRELDTTNYRSRTSSTLSTIPQSVFYPRQNRTKRPADYSENEPKKIKRSSFKE